MKTLGMVFLLMIILLVAGFLNVIVTDYFGWEVMQ
jgi:hypothetical protein